MGEQYTVKFPDGVEATYLRHNFRVLSHEQSKTGLGDSMPDAGALAPFIIYRCVVGSFAFGLETEESDRDIRGVYVPPAEVDWSLTGAPEQFDLQDREECYWEIRKFLLLALKANPNVLECLYTPHVEYASPIMERILERRDAFLSKMIYQTYNSYVLSQFKKMSRDIENRGQVRPKHAMHLIRLLVSGIEILKTGKLETRVPTKLREKLLMVKRGEMDWDKLESWRLALHQEFTEHFSTTNLPDLPDYETVNDLLIQARRSML